MDSESGSFPPALYFVLKYLPLYELLVMGRVSRLLRDTVMNDTLLWLDMVADKPLSRRISDDTLMQMASKAQGRLRRLALINCHRVTDEGLLRVVEDNPLLEKLYLPGCTGLTPNGIISSVRSLTERNSHLKSLKIGGIYLLSKDHLSLLRSLFQVPSTTHLQRQPPPQYYHNYKNSPCCSLLDDETHHSIDVEICPRCDEVKMVFDCPRETCAGEGRGKPSKCRGCSHCTPRCEECGACITKEEDEEETVCADNLCPACWLHLPKCSFCNKPYCRQHLDQYLQNNPSKATDYVCKICTERYLEPEGALDFC